MPVFQPCAFHVILLILCFSLVIDNIPMESIWLRLRAGSYPIMNACPSISAQFFCKIKLFSFWVHLNAIPTCVIIYNLSWTYVFHYTTTYHATGSIVVHVNSPKPDFIGTATDSWRYMILYLLPSDWMWHCFYIIWSCPGFSIIFHDEIFYEYPMIFLDWYLIGSIKNIFPILSLF